MDQHPVPQNISSYEFRLVGDMTLKQFFQLAGGVAVAVVIYRLPLPFILKWPMMGLAALTGVMLAFVPVSGRPFSQWIVAFIKAIYSPTEFHWSEVPQPSATMNHEPTNQVTKKTPLDLVESQLIARFSQIFTNPTTLFSPLPPKNQPPAPSSLLSPDRPNLLTGQVLNSAGLSLEGVILELSDATGLPVRALRSNKLGQFMTATPLSPGAYILTAEKEGFRFTPVPIQIENRIISPIILKAHA